MVFIVNLEKAEVPAVFRDGGSCPLVLIWRFSAARRDLEGNLFSVRGLYHTLLGRNSQRHDFFGNLCRLRLDASPVRIENDAAVPDMVPPLVAGNLYLQQPFCIIIIH